MSNPCTDHLGNQYPTTSAMCTYWGIPRTTYTQRIKRGWTVEEALTDTGQCERFIPCTDHTGRKFPSLNAMCRFWYVAKNTYNDRRERGWTLEEALTGTGPYRQGTPCTDHLGQTFTSKAAMCEHWGTTRDSYDARLKRGWTLEEALNGRRSCSDHTGQTFPSQAAMCRHWGINHHTFSMRIARGLTVEQALTLPKQRRGPAKKRPATIQPAVSAA